jgi:hypothetical protein
MIHQAQPPRGLMFGGGVASPEIRVSLVVVVNGPSDAHPARRRHTMKIRKKRFICATITGNIPPLK